MKLNPFWICFIYIYVKYIYKYLYPYNVLHVHTNTHILKKESLMKKFKILYCLRKLYSHPLGIRLLSPTCHLDHRDNQMKKVQQLWKNSCLTEKLQQNPGLQRKVILSVRTALSVPINALNCSEGKPALSLVEPQLKFASFHFYCMW